MNAKILFTVLLCLLLNTNILYAQNNNLPHTNESFSKAKKLMKKVYYDNQYSFYCGCQYDYEQINGKEKTVVNASSCGYTPRKNIERGKYIEWEHVVPAHAFGNTRQCWREEICTDSKGKAYKGRKCCEKRPVIIDRILSGKL